MIVKDMLKKSLYILMCIFVFVNVFLLNVVLHEAGHYAAAVQYGLEPQIEFDIDGVRDALSFSLKSKAIASTSFIDNGNKENLFVIVSMGPFVNLILGLIFMTLFFVFRKKNFFAEMILIAGIVSFGAFVMNILPFEGIDGKVMLDILK
ncbi:MAG: hypothetical protein AABX83_01015 [Nanoarchaeota archaeon]